MDILAGETPERVLVMTGPAGVGKTMLIDRALEEVAGPVAILYVDFNEIAPVFRSQLDEMRDADWNPGNGVLEDLDPQAPMGQICKLVVELMARDGDRKSPEPGWTPQQWWSRIMEDLTRPGSSSPSTTWNSSPSWRRRSPICSCGSGSRAGSTSSRPAELRKPPHCLTCWAR